MSFIGVGLDLLVSAGETGTSSVITSILDTAGLSVGAAGRAALGAALPYVHAGLNAGLSANRIGSILSDAGLGVRRSTLLGVVNVLRTSYGYPPYISSSQAGLYPPASSFQFAFGRYQKQYNVIVTVNLRDPLTGEETESNLTLSSDRLLTLDEIDNLVLEYAPSTVYQPGGETDLIGFSESTSYAIDAVRVAP